MDTRNTDTPDVISPDPTGSAVASSSQCSATTGKGERCRAKPLRGRDVCLTHSRTPEERRRAAQVAAARSAEVRAGQVAEREDALERVRMSTRERIAEVLEELQGDVEAAYRAALRTGSPEDLRRAQAAELLMSRVHGRPAQPTRDETPTLHGDLAALEAMSLEELAQLARGLPTHPEPA